MKAVLVDLDGTLFDTKEVNYMAYKKALEPYGYGLEYGYYCSYCNGRYYMDFLPQISTSDKTILEKVHSEKKVLYKKYLEFARLNKHLVELLDILHKNAKIGIVTTASRESTNDILKQFKLENYFDIILTQEDVSARKPHPDGYIKAMNLLHVEPEETIIFEDSDVGIEAAEKSGAQCFVVKGYN